MCVAIWRGLGDAVGLVRSLPYFVRYRRLQKSFGFNRWHVRSPFPRRAYKARVVKMIDSFCPETVVEVGCGLGEIISRTNARNRFGFDLEAAVIAAAARPHGTGAIFHQGDLRVPGGIACFVCLPIDVLVAVNWPHMLPFDEFERALQELGKNLPVSILVIDTIRPEHSGYEHHHTIDDVRRLGTMLTTISGGDGIRDIHAVKLASGGAVKIA